MQSIGYFSYFYTTLNNMATKFKPGMTAVIASDKTGICRTETVAEYGYSKGDLVSLLEYDSRDESWEIEKPGTDSIYIKRKHLKPVEKTDERLYVRCAKTNQEYYIEGEEYEVLETDSDGYATKIINEYGRPWRLVDPREDTFMNLPYRGKREDRKKIEPEEPKTDHTAEIKRLGYKPVIV